LGLGVSLEATKPEIAEAIASAGGQEWDDDCDSRNAPSGGGSTVTLEGLNRVLGASISVLTKPAATKQEALDRIGRLICRPGRKVSVGSSEPREVFLDIAIALELLVDLSATKPELAEHIARAGGEGWDDSCDSRGSRSGGGSTVTLRGLNQVIRAVVAAKATRAINAG
jgi:hypothetical protein